MQHVYLLWQIVGFLLFLVGVAEAMTCWLLAATLMVYYELYRSPREPFRFFSPNFLMDSSKLPDGILVRRILLGALLGFVAFLGLSAATGLSIGLLH